MSFLQTFAYPGHVRFTFPNHRPEPCTVLPATAMINSLHLRNFKGIRRADVGLERLTVLVGPNASGKTSFLEALTHLGGLWVFNPSRIFEGQRNPIFLYRRNASGEEMELSCSWDKGNLRLRIIPPPGFSNFLTHQIEPVIDEWTFHLEFQPVSNVNDNWQAIDGQTTSEWEALFRMLGSAILLRLDPARMTISSDSAKIEMGSDGQWLSSALAFLALNQPDEFHLIQKRLKAVVPSIERIRFKQEIENGKHVNYQILFDFQGSPEIPAHLASEGTILVLGLLTALTGSGHHDLVLLDDLDRGLHPRAQREVIGLLRTMLDQYPDLQIVATTHSPYLVDCLRPEEVRLTTLGDDGTVSIASLVEHPDFDKWKDEMAPGEMWSLFGEKWVGDLQKDSVEK